ncbi:hypothetical protein O181_003941 [Austropuccinia psidii MF-1]|uniref:Uncharacterized protein n=1 Tax=Austropuccinia psidii MF-1 TaxID=1389203 RepID=A0A9Q3BFX8_9BASI|nr:hypothetical protein [Austropuccinia psidii MF-1]
MDLDQDIHVKNPKDKNVSPERGHKWRMQELPPVPKGRNRDIPVSVKELVYGGKAAGVGASAKSLGRHNELLLSSEEDGPRKDRRTSEGLDTHVLQGTIPTDKSLVEKPKNVIRGQKKKLDQGKENSPVEAPQASTSKNMLQQVPNKEKQTPRSNEKGKQKAVVKAKPK